MTSRKNGTVAQTLKNGSFLVLLASSKHLSRTSVFTHYTDFTAWVRAVLLNEDATDVVSLTAIYGNQVQQYTPAEVREVFFNE